MEQVKNTQKIEELKAYRSELVSRLNELKAERAKVSGEGKAARYRELGDRLVNTDPSMAAKYYSMADEMVAGMQTSQNESSISPQTIRMKLFSSANSMSSKMKGLNVDSKNYDQAKRMQNWMYEEANKENPTLRMPLTVIYDEGDGDGGKGVVDPTDPEFANKVLEGSSDEKASGNLIKGTSISNGSVQKKGNISSQAGDWYELKEVDGFNKPALRSDAIDVLNMPIAVRKLYDADLEKWKSNNDTAKSRGNTAAVLKKAEELYSKFKPIYTKRAAGLMDISFQLRSLMAKYNDGDYALANFSDLKTTMNDGRMTDGDVSIATGLTGVGAIWQGIASNLSGSNWANQKLTSKENARTAINRIIQGYQDTVEGLSNPRFNGKYKEQLREVHNNQSYGTLIPTDKFAKLGGSTKAPESEQMFESNGKLTPTELGILNDLYEEYTANGGKLPANKLAAMKKLATQHRGK